MADKVFKKDAIDLPRQRGNERLENGPKAKSASLDKRGQTLKVELTNGVVLMIPTCLVQILNGASFNDLARIDILLDGLYLSWPLLGEDLKVQSLIEGTFGTAKWMGGLKEHLAELGRKGGSVRSKSKIEAARTNGAKGGRPRKVGTA